MEFITKSISEKGSFHEKNEDNYICDDNYIIIADGMGGEASGEVASDIAIQTISSIFNKSLYSLNSEEEIRELALSSILQADKEILNYIKSHPEADGMGTTVVLMIRKDENLYVAWCGDSRCYYYQPGDRLRSLTTDHSYVQQLIDEGKISLDESYSHPDNNLITKYVGGGKYMCNPEFVSAHLTNNSSVLLCSDGLSGYCRNEDIEKVIDSTKYDSLTARLLELAIKNGSNDDITIVALTPKIQANKNSSSIFECLKKLIHS